MKNNNMFNTVKKGIIRSAALLLLAGFCGNVSANLDDFVNELSKEKALDNIQGRIEQENNGGINVLTKSVFNADEIKNEINAQNPNYEQVLLPLFQTLSDYHTDIFQKDYPFNKFATIINNRKPATEINNDDMKKEVSGVVDSVVADLLILRDMKQLLETKNSELQAVEAQKDAWKTMDANLIIDGNENVHELEQQRQNLKANMNALLNWNDKDNNPVVDGFDGSALKALVEALKAPKVLSKDDVVNHEFYKNLFRTYNKSQDNLKELKALIADLNQSLVETSIQGLDGDASKIKDNFDTVLAELDRLKKQLEAAEANKVDVNALGKEGLKDNVYVKGLKGKLQQAAQQIRELIDSMRLLTEGKDSLEAQLNEAKETAENELSELKTKFAELISARENEIDELNERIAELDSEIESKEGCISALEEQNKQLISRVELLNSNAIQLTAQLASMQNELQLAKDNTNKFENDDDELNDIEESATRLDNQSVENEETEDENIGLSDGEESSTPLKESTKSEEPEEDEFDLDAILNEASTFNTTIKNHETQKPSATSAASQPAAKTETQKKTSTSASSQSATKSAKAKTQEKTSTSASQSATKTAKTETKNQSKEEEIYKELFGDNFVTPGNDDNPVLDGVDTEASDDPSADSKNKKDQSIEEDKYKELFGDYMTPGNPAKDSDQ